MRAGPNPLFVAEPPASCRMRPPLVVDCSALSAILFDEPTRGEALARLVGFSLHAPNLLDHEIVGVALKKKRQDWSSDSIALALADYAEYDLELHPVDRPRSASSRRAMHCRPTTRPTSGSRRNSRRRSRPSTRSSQRRPRPT